MTIEAFNDTHVLIPLVGVCLVIILGALAWAARQIYQFIDQQFVRKLECQKCVNIIKDDFHRNIDFKYDQVCGKVEEVRRDFMHYIESIQEIAEKRNETMVRIETKVDLLIGSNRGDSNGFKL